jgi:hypothetical protein
VFSYDGNGNEPPYIAFAREIINTSGVLFDTNFINKIREENGLQERLNCERRVTCSCASGFPYLCRRVQFGELNVFVQARR